MANVKYSYTKSINPTQLGLEIQASTIAVALDHIDTNGTAVDIWFKAELSAGEKTTLDSLVDAHVPVPTPADVMPVSFPDTPYDELHRPCVRADSRDDHDTTIFTTRGDLWTAVTGEAVGTGDGAKKDFYLDNMEVRAVKIYCDGVEQISGVSVDYSTYPTNNQASHFCRGKVSFATAPLEGVVITADYQYASIADDVDNQLVFNLTAGQTRTMWLVFCDPIHIKDGVAYFSTGSLDSVLNMYVIVPAGGYYKDNNGNIAYASQDVTIAHYVNNHIMYGSAEMGHYFDVEARSTAMPKGYKIKVIVSAGSADSLKGAIRLEMNRERTQVV